MKVTAPSLHEDPPGTPGANQREKNTQKHRAYSVVAAHTQNKEICKQYGYI